MRVQHDSRTGTERRQNGLESLSSVEFEQRSSEDQRVARSAQEYERMLAGPYFEAMELRRKAREKR